MRLLNSLPFRTTANTEIVLKLEVFAFVISHDPAQDKKVLVFRVQIFDSTEPDWELGVV